MITSLRLRSSLLGLLALVVVIGVVRVPAPLVDAQDPPPDIVLHTTSGTVTGAWRIVSDTTAASGRAAVLPDASRPRVTTPLANPADYFEISFTVEANTPYHLWLRGRAERNGRGNDSAHVQFSNSMNESGTAAWRIGSTSAATVILEPCDTCGIAGWGWEDNGWGTPTTLGPEIRFATSGTTTLRIQSREDGFRIDQIVLSPQRYLGGAPGPNRNDTTILAPTTPPPAVSEIVLHAASATVAGAWQIVSDSSAASGRATLLPDAARPRVNTPLANPADYVELTFTAAANTPYHLWVRGRADGNLRENDSAHVQFSDSVNESGAPMWRIGSTSAATVILEPCDTCGIAGWGWEDNGRGTPTTLGADIRFATSGTHRLRVQSREDGFRIDQIVLSPQRYLDAAPGANRNDTTILTPTTPPPPPPSLTVVRLPYLQQMTTTSVIIVWATRESGTAQARVDGRTFTAQSTRFTVARTGFSFDYYQHQATVTGLDADTTYSYELRVDGNVAATGDSFTTAPASGAVRFIAFGDSGIGSAAQKALATRMASDTWDLALHVGDIVYGSSSTSGDATYLTYQSWFFDIYRDWLKRRPFFPSMGNHDGRATNNWGQAYLDLFVLPDDAGAGSHPDHAERYYSFDYGPVHFVALDTEFAFQDTARRAVQLEWLRNDLSATTQPWKIAYWHRAPYSAGGEHGSDGTVRAALGPILEQYGVQVALTGHEHVYERTVPWRESTDPSRQAVTYFITGGGGARLYPAAIASWTAFSKSDYQYLRVNVDGCVLTAASIDRNGATADSFTLDRCAQASDAGSPTARVTAPASGATVSGTITITAAATDDVRVEKVDFRVDGVLKRIDRAAPYTYSWNSTSVPAGTHRIDVRAYDIDGNRVTSTAVTVTTTGS